MPRIYRTMKRADDGLPLVEATARGLGVRVPPDTRSDVDVDSAGNVILNGRGMSVAEHWRHIFPGMIPARLDDGHNGARGSDELHCWRMGEGPFVAGPLADKLQLILKEHARKSGLVVPSESLPAQAFQDALAATRGEWIEDES